MRKQIFSILMLLIISNFAFSSDVSNLLKAAQAAYESGDLTTAIQNIDSAKKIIENEKISSGTEDYIELNSWDIVKLKKTEYIGKKVKIKTQFIMIMNDGSVLLHDITSTYDDSVIDKLLDLKEFKVYTFYGTVKERYSNPILHIEAIE